MYTRFFAGVIIGENPHPSTDLRFPQTPVGNWGPLDRGSISPNPKIPSPNGGISSKENT